MKSFVALHYIRRRPIDNRQFLSILVHFVHVHVRPLTGWAESRHVPNPREGYLSATRRVEADVVNLRGRDSSCTSGSMEEP